MRNCGNCESFASVRKTRFCCGPFEAHTVGFSGQEDADPDIPILKQARAEYARLK